MESTPSEPASERQSRFSFGNTDEAAFEEHQRENPKLYAVLRRFALEARRAGRERLGIAMLYERVRWYTTVETKDDSFKLNNNWRAWYARKLMNEEPELAGMFETRKAKADK